MRLKRFAAIVLLSALAQMVWAGQLSDEFKNGIDRALKAETAEDRAELLIQVAEGASTNELIRGMPGFFPHEILRTARNEGVCISEIDALLSEMTAAIEMGVEEYLESSREEYLSVLSQSIRCIHLGYRDGIPIRQ